ncbi:MAG: helix-turn-helix domain-containing protein [Muribaculaceae bacterium]
MSKILKVRKPGDFIRYIGGREQHPLIGIVDYAAISPIPHTLNNYDVYGVFMHKNLSIGLTYGSGRYGYPNGSSVICVAPGQIGGKEDNGERINLDGWALLFHPDLLHNSPLEKSIGTYSFFDYNVNEALHTTEEEFTLLANIMKRIQMELATPADDVQTTILLDYISLLLNYCKRFYNRQFQTSKVETTGMLQRLSSLLEDYFSHEEQFKLGLPSVTYCADRLCMSAGYFSDIVKRHTGDSAKEYILQFVIKKAKSLLSGGDSISTAAYKLGFEYPHHLSRLFKKKEGITPTEYLEKLKR